MPCYSKLITLLLIILACIGMSSSFGNNLRLHRRMTTALFARRSQTARESAVRVEWEPVSELERRIEDGIHYQHWPEKRRQYHQKADPDAPIRQGVFCGYITTQEDYKRLKSADPDDNEAFNYYSI
jgi:hypothetical protein